MRFPWGFNPPKESFETRTLIGRMWKRSNALSWPILIAREAWSYNLKTWSNSRLMVCSKEKQWFRPCNQYPIWPEVNTSMTLLLPICYRRLMKMRRQHSISACVLVVKTHETPVMLGGHSGLEPPLPISNRAVKRTSANDSMLFACESRSLPSYSYKKPRNECCGVFYCLKTSLLTKKSIHMQSTAEWINGNGTGLVWYLNT